LESNSLRTIERLLERSFWKYAKANGCRRQCFYTQKVRIPIKQELRMRCHQHSPNSPNLNPIENIWVYIKHIIVKKYSHITSIREVKQVVLKI